MDDLGSLFREHQSWAVAITVSSAAMFAGSVVLLPWLVARASSDHFVRRHRPESRAQWTRVVVRNVVGALFVLLGLAMLVLPGQGLLTLLVGVSLLDFPGKRKLELRLVRHENVRRSLQWLRRRAGKPPFEIPEPPA